VDAKTCEPLWGKEDRERGDRARVKQGQVSSHKPGALSRDGHSKRRYDDSTGLFFCRCAVSLVDFNFRLGQGGCVWELFPARALRPAQTRARARRFESAPRRRLHHVPVITFALPLRECRISKRGSAQKFEEGRCARRDPSPNFSALQASKFVLSRKGRACAGTNRGVPRVCRLSLLEALADAAAKGTLAAFFVLLISGIAAIGGG